MTFIAAEAAAKSIGYLIGFGSLILYTPIAIRIFRQKHANGLVISTWWLKLCSYILSDIYYTRKHYILSTWSETFIITIESIVVLFLVAYYQKQIYSFYPFWFMVIIFIFFSIYGFTFAPIQIILFGQLSSAIINTAALVPQFYYNHSNKSKGDYSPLTCILAGVGCFIRLFTTIILNNSDPILLLTFISAMTVNFALLLQIIYYGIQIEGLTLKQVFTADVIITPESSSSSSSSSSTGNILMHDDNNNNNSNNDGSSTSLCYEKRRIDLQLVPTHDNVPTEQCGLQLQQQQQQQNYHNQLIMNDGNDNLRHRSAVMDDVFHDESTTTTCATTNTTTTTTTATSTRHVGVVNYVHDHHDHDHGHHDHDQLLK